MTSYEELVKQRDELRKEREALERTWARRLLDFLKSLIPKRW
jgi:hypothetical protein